MKKTSILFIACFLVIGIITLNSLVLAEENNSNNNSNNETNDTLICDSDNLNLCLNETNCTTAGGFWYNDTCNEEAESVECTEDDDCDTGYECEDNLCVLDDDDEEENETEEDKVCCMMERTAATRYRWVESEDCATTSQIVSRQVVDDDLCEDIKEAIKEKNRIKFEARTGQECSNGCVCTGRVMKCPLDGGGREMTVYAGSGNIIVQVKGINMTTSVTLFHHNNKTYGNFSNGTLEIILPDQVQEKIRLRIKQRTCDCDEMNLTEDAIYEVKAKKKARLFWIFPVREKARVQVDAESGEILKFRNPWWGFLANDVEETEE